MLRLRKSNRRESLWKWPELKFMSQNTLPNRRHVQRYKERLIKADPDDPRHWYVYCVGAEGCPVLYIGISTNPERRFKKHMERFKEAPQPLSLRVNREPLQRVAARRMEIDLHTKHPHARTVTTALEHLLVLSKRGGDEPSP